MDLNTRWALEDLFCGGQSFLELPFSTLFLQEIVFPGELLFVVQLRV